MFRSASYLKGSGALQMGETIPPTIVSKFSDKSQAVGKIFFISARFLIFFRPSPGGLSEKLWMTSKLHKSEIELQQYN